MFWSRHAERLKAEGVHVIVSKYDPLQRCLDKLRFYTFGQANNLPFIPTSERIEDLTGERFVVKERFGAGSRAMGINLNRGQALVHASTLGKPIFQPYIEGLEFSVDAWVNREHKVKGLVLRRRDSVVNGESQITTTFTDKILEEKVQKVIEALELEGPIVLQAILDASGAVHIIECNPRFGGASTAGISAGVNSFYWSLLEAQGIAVEDNSFSRIVGEIRQIRILADIYIHDSNI
jgi:carbamoyl-phosphate synthase large subunit